MHTNSASPKSTSLCAAAMSLGILLGGCVTAQEEPGAPRKEVVHAVTAANKLVSFNAGQPQKILSQLPITGLQDKETVVGIDYRVAKGWLYLLGSSGRLYRLDASSGAVQMVGNGPATAPGAGTEAGFDFNPTVDRIRLVYTDGRNMRLHPDLGTLVDSDPNTPGIQVDGKLAYAAGDVNAGRPPSIAAAAYTYNKNDEKITTNFAIDVAHGTLVTQGSREGKLPAVSPNTGQLYTVGALGIGSMEKTSFDIADISGSAYMATSKPGATKSSWFEIDLVSGKAKRIGTIGTDEPVVGIAIEP